jgi:hypothetical protein
VETALLVAISDSEKRLVCDLRCKVVGAACWAGDSKLVCVRVNDRRVSHPVDFFPAHAAPYARRTQTPDEVVVFS